MTRAFTGPQRKRAAFAVLFVFGLVLVALPGLAHAVPSVRVEAITGQLVPRADVTLPSAPVAPKGAPDGETCPGNSIIGALDAATGGDWSGQWSDQDGWSIDRIRNVDATQSLGWHWVVYSNYEYLNTPPCHTSPAENAILLFYPSCTFGHQCFSGEPLILAAPAGASPGVRLQVSAAEVTTTFNNAGIGSSAIAPSFDATVTSPEGYTLTDEIFGYGLVTIKNRGPSQIMLTKANRVPDRATVCISDGADGYCGTTIAPPTPFNPLDFCQTTGIDGYCNTVDKTPPVLHIAVPAQAKSYTTKTRPSKFTGTVDTDASEVTQVQLRVLRQSKVTVTKYKKKKVRDKKTHKRVVKKIAVKSKQTRCFTWSPSKGSWTVLKMCDVANALWFKADGDEVWSYEYLSALPAGSYTLDAKAFDGAGNADATPELGRNRVTFSIS